MKKEGTIPREENDPCVAVSLCRTSWGQIMDGLSCRAEQYEFTAQYHECGYVDENILEVRDAVEARNLAEWYRRLVENIRKQLV